MYFGGFFILFLYLALVYLSFLAKVDILGMINDVVGWTRGFPHSSLEHEKELRMSNNYFQTSCFHVTARIFESTKSYTFKEQRDYWSFLVLYYLTVW